MSGEKFCLKWNEFQTNIASTLREIRDDKEFFDVTLACEEEGQQVQAHKVVLAVCSPFFRSVLQRNPHERPLIYLKGVKFNELAAVLNFMYHGEVNVAQEELSSFLSIADELKVKGLSQNLTCPVSKKSSTPSSVSCGGTTTKTVAVTQQQPPILSSPSVSARLQPPSAGQSVQPPPTKRPRVSQVGRLTKLFISSFYFICVFRIRIFQFDGSGMFIPDPTFFHPGSELSPSRIPDPHQRI
jgi:hypothetical protein